MITHNLIQGSDAWHAFRAKHFNASEAAAIFGQHKYMTRAELLALKKTGIEKDVNDFQQAAFDRGHQTEAMARPFVEDLIGEELYPAVASDDDDWLAASFDGITLGDDIVFEHKLLNADLVAQVQAGQLEPHYYWQLEQQLLISGAEKVIFVTSDGTRENFHWMEYRPVPGRAEQLIAGWKQFESDLAAYVPEPAKAAVVAAPVETLPAIVYNIDRSNMTLTSNLRDFRAAAEILVERSKSPLVTDQDFADRDALCKAFGEAEKLLKMKAEEVIGQIEDVARFSRELGNIAEMFRTARLAGEKLVEAEKKNRRLAIQQGGEKALAAHIAALNTRLGRVRLPQPQVDFAGAMKGKKTIDSLQNAVDTLLAQAKVETTAMAEKMILNLCELDDLAGEYGFLFADLQQIVTMPAEAFTATVKGRIAEHKAQEDARLAADRERIANEEREKAEAAAQAKIAAQQAAATASAQADVPATEPAPGPATPAAQPIASQKSMDEEFDIPAYDAGARIKLGDINARIAPLSITADGLAALGFQHVGTGGAAKLYRADEFPRICAAIVAHIGRIQMRKVAA